jgi:hypothetical protein
MLHTEYEFKETNYSLNEIELGKLASAEMPPVQQNVKNMSAFVQIC